MQTAFSYVRFSSAKQELGDSLRRQVKLAEDYAKEHGLHLDTKTYQDLGVSAFKGKNAVEGKLGTFIEAVEKSLIPKGSYLLVESLDRISRAEVDEALELFLRIIRSGVTIVTLTDRQAFSKASIKKDRGIGLIVSILVMIRAHEESLTKSTRIREAWLNKRNAAAEGRIMTGMAPAWLSPSADRTKWLIDDKKAAIVRRIFELSLSGLGTPTIARKFNADGVPTMKRAATWTFGVVNAILKNEAVIGTYVPKKAEGDPIKGYFPVIVSETQFYQVRDALKNRLWVGGRNQVRVANLFTGCSYCSACQNAMRVKSTQNDKTYLQCILSYSGGDCDAKIFPYYGAERAITQHLATVIAQLAHTGPDVEDPRLILEAKREDVNKKIEILVDALAEVNSPAIKDKIIKLQAQADEIQSEIGRTVDPVRQEDAKLLNQLKHPEKLPVEDRLRVQTLLKRIVESVNFDTEGLTVAVKYRDQVKRHVDFIAVRPFLDKVGGDRRKRD